MIVDVLGKESGTRIAMTADLNDTTRSTLNQRLWVEGNLSVDYGGTLDAGDTSTFGLIFDPKEMQSALKVPLPSLNIAENTFGLGYLEASPFEAACFPYAQHFVTTSMPTDIGLRNGDQLEQAVSRFSAQQNKAESQLAKSLVRR